MEIIIPNSSYILNVHHKIDNSFLKTVIFLLNIHSQDKIYLNTFETGPYFDTIAIYFHNIYYGCHYAHCQDEDIDNIPYFKIDQHTIKYYIDQLYKLLQKLDQEYEQPCYVEFIAQILNLKTGREFIDNLSYRAIIKIEEDTKNYEEHRQCLINIFEKHQIKAIEVDNQKYFKTQIFYQEY